MHKAPTFSELVTYHPHVRCVSNLQSSHDDRLMQSPMVAVHVGTTRRKFEIPGNLLSFHSVFFRMALNGGFIEAANYSVDLPEEEPKLFETIVDWMYEYKRPLKVIDKYVVNRKMKPNHDGPLRCARELCALAYVADKLDIKALQDSIRHEIAQTIEWDWKDYNLFPFDAALLVEVYENTPETSWLRAFVTTELYPLLHKDVPYSQSLLDEFESCFKQVPDLAWDVITLFSGRQPGGGRGGSSNINERGRLSDSMSQELMKAPLDRTAKNKASLRKR